MGEKIGSKSADICGKWLLPKYTKNTKYSVKFIDSLLLVCGNIEKPDKVGKAQVL